MPDIRKIAKEMGIKGYGNMYREELLDIICDEIDAPLVKHQHIEELPFQRDEDAEGVDEIEEMSEEEVEEEGLYTATEVETIINNMLCEFRTLEKRLQDQIRRDEHKIRELTRLIQQKDREVMGELENCQEDRTNLLQYYGRTREDLNRTFAQLEEEKIEKSECQRELHLLQNQLQDVKANQQELKQCRARLEEKCTGTEEVTQLEDRLNNCNQQLQDLQEEVANKESKLERFEKQLAEKSENLSSCSEAYKEKEEELSQCSSELERSKGEVSEEYKELLKLYQNLALKRYQLIRIYNKRLSSPETFSEEQFRQQTRNLHGESFSIRNQIDELEGRLGI